MFRGPWCGAACRDRQPLCRNVQWFRGGLVFKAHRLLYHSTLGLIVIQKSGEQPASFATKTMQNGECDNAGAKKLLLTGH